MSSQQHQADGQPFELFHTFVEGPGAEFDIEKLQCGNKWWFDAAGLKAWVHGTADACDKIMVCRFTVRPEDIFTVEQVLDSSNVDSVRDAFATSGKKVLKCHHRNKQQWHYFQFPFQRLAKLVATRRFTLEGLDSFVAKLR